MTTLQSQYEYDVVATVSHLIPEFHCIIITDKKGDLHSYLCSEDCANCQKLSDIAEVAKLLSNRLRFGEYNEILGKFQLATVSFQKHHLIGRFIPNDKTLIISISRDVQDLESRINKIINVFKMPYFNEKEEITEIKEKLKPIPPMPIDIQREGQKLAAKKYVLVAEQYTN